MSFTKDCIAGVRHEGEPEGTIEKLGGIDTYIALPKMDYPKEKAVLFLTGAPTLVPAIPGDARIDVPHAM